jgi:hypothetical protein
VDVEDDDGVYVKIDKFFVLAPDAKSQQPDHFKSVVQLLRRSGLVKGAIIGFKRDKWAKLGDGWVPLEKHVAENFEKLVGTKRFSQELADYLAARAHTALLPGKIQLPSGSLAHKLVSEINRMLNPKAPKVLLESMHNREFDPWLKCSTTLPAPTVNLENLDEQVRSTYPLLNHWALRTYENLQGVDSTQQQDIANYIRLINK